MTNNLTTMEESEYWDEIVNPFLTYIGNGLFARKKVARSILTRPKEDIILVEAFGFGIDSVFAGLSESQMEYFAKHAPVQHKKELMEIFKDEEMLKGVWEIARAMDEDEGNNLQTNQQRIKRNIQYIRDNQIVFQS